MAKERVSIFSAGESLDVSSFAPKPKIDTSAPPAEQVRAVSQTAQFRSREAPVPKHEPETKPKRAPRIYRTGRNVQISIKASKETADALYAITDANPGWVLGYTLQRALEALQRELKKQS